MNLTKQLQKILDKSSEEILFPEEKEIIEQAIAASRYENKKIVLEILKKYSGDWAHKLLQQLIKDKDDLIVRYALELIEEYEDVTDYTLLKNIALNSSTYKSFLAIHMMGNLAWNLNMDEENWLHDIQEIDGIRKESLVQLGVMNNYYYIFLDSKYLVQMSKSLYHKSLMVRQWTMNLYDQLLDIEEEYTESVKIIEDIIIEKLKKGDATFEIKTSAHKLYTRIRENYNPSSKEIDFFQEEHNREKELLENINKEAKTEDILSYAVLLSYYPFKNYKKAVDILKKYADSLEDVRLDILGAYYLCYYKIEGYSDKENPFLGRLLQKAESYSNREQAVIYMLQGVEIALHNNENKKEAFSYFSLAEAKDPACVGIYKEIIYFSKPYSRQTKEAKRKEALLEKRLTVQEMNQMSIQCKYSYSTFFNLEICRNYVKPEGFDI